MGEVTFRTLPGWATELGLPLDRLREIVRRSPQLKRLGHKYGPTRVYSRAEVGAIREAFEAKYGALAKV